MINAGMLFYTPQKDKMRCVLNRVQRKQCVNLAEMASLGRGLNQLVPLNRCRVILIGICKFNKL